MTRSLSALAALTLAVGCGSGSSPPPPPGNEIPSPGTGGQVNTAFDDQEPNDSPHEATPLGVANSGDLVIWVGDNTIGGSDNPADYFVFESGPVDSQLAFNMCFTAPIASMTASLWKVVDHAQVTPPVATWPITMSCGDSLTAPLEANTAYLFGVEATGGVGTYTA